MGKALISGDWIKSHSVSPRRSAVPEPMFNVFRFWPRGQCFSMSDIATYNHETACNNEYHAIQDKMREFMVGKHYDHLLTFWDI